jgi:hypothetical protein
MKSPYGPAFELPVKASVGRIGACGEVKGK